MQDTKKPKRRSRNTPSITLSSLVIVFAILSHTDAQTITPKVISHLQDNEDGDTRSVRAINDVNGDGFKDVLIATFYWGPESEPGGHRHLEVLDGRTGSLIYEPEFTPPETGDSRIILPRQFVQLNDFNKDGIDDFLLSHYEINETLDEYAALVISGKTGKTLRMHESAGLKNRFGEQLSRLGDLNQDGFDEYGISETINSLKSIHIYDGLSGHIQTTLQGEPNSFGYSSVRCAGIKDLDNDGFHDIALLDNELNAVIFVSGGIHGSHQSGGIPEKFVISSYYHSDLEPFQLASGAFTPINSVSDLDDDGFEDVIIRQRASTSGRARSLTAISSKKGSIIWDKKIPIDRTAYWTAEPLIEIGDLDGNGRADFLVGWEGFLNIISGENGSYLYSRRFSDSCSRFDAISDLDEDGIVDIVFGHGSIRSSESKNIPIYSFGPGKPDSDRIPEISRLGEKLTFSWEQFRPGAILQTSTDLQHWTEIPFSNQSLRLLEVPANQQTSINHYRLKYVSE